MTSIQTLADRAEWLAARAQLPGFGASEAANFFGCGFQSAAHSVLAKAGLERPWQPDKEMAEKMELATDLEGALAEVTYARVTGRPTKKLGTTIFRHDPLFATPDAVTEDGSRLVQVKTSAETPWDAPPLGYVVQVQQEMLCAQAPVADLAVLFYGGGTLAFRVFEVQADVEFQELLEERVKAAWAIVEQIKNGQPFELPEPGPDDGALLARFSKSKKVTVIHQFSLAQAEAVARWRRIDEDRKVYSSAATALEKLEKHERHKLVAVMNGADLGQLPDGTKFKATVRERDGYQVGPSSFVELKEVSK
jgi:hypothetical protein